MAEASKHCYNRFKKLFVWLILFFHLGQPIAAQAAQAARASRSRPVVKLDRPQRTRPVAAPTVVVPAHRDPAQQGHPTRTDTAANGVPVLSIQTPSAAGVSYNPYDQFNVGASGLILNNSYATTTTQLAGYIQGNPNLAQGSARIILSEVTGPNPSYLYGYTEIAGRQAEFILANPYGIVGDGFGFINTSRATLTTGVPVFDTQGGLGTFRVTQGNITIQGAGLNAANIDRVDLISRTTAINAGLWAKKLNVITGANNVDYQSLAIEKLDPADDPPAVSLDVSQLGGMYANQIILVGTEKGVGVNSQGVITADDDLIITQDGKIILSGNTNAKGNMAIQGSDVTQRGSLYAQGNTQMNATGTIDNTGSTTAGGDIHIKAASIRSDNLLAAGILSDGSLGAGGNLDLTAADQAVLTGRQLAGQDLTIAANSIDLSGSDTYAGRNASLTAAGGGILHRNAGLQAGNHLTLHADAAFDNQNGSIRAGQVTIEAQALSNQAGQISHFGAQPAIIQIIDTFDNTGGTVQTAGDFTLSADRLINRQGILAGNGSIGLTATDTFDNYQGTLQSIKRLDLGTASLDNREGIIQAEQLAIEAKTLSNQAGQISHFGEQPAIIQVTDTFDNTGGTVQTAGDFILSANRLINRQGILAGNGSIGLTATDTFDNYQGTLQSGKGLNLNSTLLDNQKGIIQAEQLAIEAQTLSNQAGQISHFGEQPAIIQVTGVFDNTGGTVQTAGDFTLSADRLINRQGILAGNGSTGITVTDTFNNYQGTVQSGQGLNLFSASLNNREGSIVNLDASGLNLTMQQSLNNQAGVIGGNGNLLLTARTLDNSEGGSLFAQKDLTLTLSADLLNTAGSLQAAQNLTLTSTAGTLRNQSGRIEGGNIAKIQAAVIDNTAGRLIAGGQELNVKATAGSLINTGGLIGSNGLASLSAQTLVNRDGGQVLTGKDLTLITPGGIDNTRGSLFAGGSLTFNQAAAHINNTQGDIGANGSLTLTARDITNTRGTVAANTDLSLTLNSFTPDGDILAGRDLSIHLGQSYTYQTGARLFANRNFTFLTDGDFTNNGNLEAVGLLTVGGQNITNNAGASMAAGAVDLNADTGTIANRGLILATAADLDEAGGWVSLNARTITNSGEPAVIAATRHIGLYAGAAVENKDGATIYSQGHILIAGSEPSEQTLSNPAWTGSLLNQSASIEAEGNIGIYAHQTLNKWRVFWAEQKETVTSESETPPIPAGYYKARRDYTQTVKETVFHTEGKQGEIRAGNQILIRGSLENNVSTILAGGAVDYDGDTLTNISYDNSRTVTKTGTDFYTYRQRYCKHRVAGHCVDHSTRDATNTNPYNEQTVTQLDRPTAIIHGNQSVNIHAQTVRNLLIVPEGTRQLDPENLGGNQDLKLNQPDSLKLTVSPNQTPAGNPGAFTPGTAPQAANTLPADTPPDPGTLPSNAPSAPTPQTVDPAAYSFTAPASGLYTTHPEPESQYLVETDPRFTRYQNFTTSDYLLDKLGLDPQATLKRLGDGFYEQKLIRDQIAELTGRRYLGEYISDEETYKALLENGAAAAKEFHLTVGIALTPDQIKNLTTDIVWMVEKEVQGQKVLVPVVYLASTTTSELHVDGALITGKNVVIQAEGSVTNTGTITSDNLTSIEAANILNRGGSIEGDTTYLKTTEDIINQSGIIAGNQVLLDAGRDIKNETLSTTFQGKNFSTTLTGPMGTIEAGQNLTALAGRDITLTGAKVTAGQDLSLQAGRNIEVNTVEQHIFSGETGWQSFHNQETTTHLQSSIQAGHNVTLVAQNDLTLRGAQVTAQNDLTALAGGNMTITAVKDRVVTEGKSGNHKNYTYVQTDDETVVGSQLTAGKNLTLAAVQLNEQNPNTGANRGNILIEGSSVQTKQGNIAIAADRDVTVKEVAEHHESYTETKKTKKKTFSKKTTLKKEYTEETLAVGSTIQAGVDQAKTPLSETAPDSPAALSVTAGNNLTVQGSRLTASGALSLSAANDLTITGAAETMVSDTATSTKKRGALSGKVKEEQQHTEITTAIASEISGDTVGLSAGRDLSVIGSAIAGTGDVSLYAKNNLNILSAQETMTTQQSSYEKKSGLSLSFSGGLNLFAGTTKLTTTLDEASTNQIGSTVGSGAGRLLLTAGKDARVSGSDLIGAAGIQAIAQNITIEGAANSTQSHFTSEFKQKGFNLSVGNKALQAAQDSFDTLNRSRDIQDNRLKALYGLKAYRSGEKASEELQKTRQNAKAEDKNIGDSFTATVGFSSSSQKTESFSSSTTFLGSSLTSLGDITLIATGSGQQGSDGYATDGDLNIFGSIVNGDNVYFSAARDVNLKAQANTMDASMTSSGKSSGFGVTASLGKQPGMGYYLEGSKSSGNSEEHATTWNETQIIGNTSLTVISGRDTNMIGAQAYGNSISMDIGRNFNLESLQDIETYSEKNKSSGGSLNYSSAKGFGGKASTYGRNIESNYSSVNEQTGIFAGDGGFNIHVKGNTDLKGAVIGSEAEPDKNRLSTGTLTWSDIENKAEYSASSAGIGYGIGNSNFTDNGLQPKLGVLVSDNDTSTTQSAIAQGAIEIRSDADKPADQRTDLSKLSRDTENANQPLANNFDKDAVKERLEVHEMIFDGVVDLVKTEVEKQRIADEKEAARKQAEDEAAKKKAEEEEAARKKQEAEEAARKERERIEAEKAEADRLAAEEAKKKAEEEGTVRNPVQYNQKDSQWAGEPYPGSGSNIGNSGCGSTSMAMVAATLGTPIWDSVKEVWRPATPLDIADLAVDGGYVTAKGTSSNFFPAIAPSFGLDCETVIGNQDPINLALQTREAMVIVQTDSRHYTTTGHIMVIYGAKKTEDGIWYDILDPNFNNGNYADGINKGLIIVDKNAPGRIRVRADTFEKNAYYHIFTRQN